MSALCSDGTSNHPVALFFHTFSGTKIGNRIHTDSPVGGIPKNLIRGNYDVYAVNPQLAENRSQFDPAFVVTARYFQPAGNQRHSAGNAGGLSTSHGAARDVSAAAPQCHGAGKLDRQDQPVLVQEDS